MEIDWLRDARFFKRWAGKSLSSAEYALLELQEVQEHSQVCRGFTAKLQEIPCVHRTQWDYQGSSGFRYFLDGVQRTVHWQHYEYDGFQVPIYLHLSGAVIMERTPEGRFRPFDAKFRSAVLVPSFIYEALDAVPGMEDTGAQEPWDLNNLRWKARARSNELRHALEEEMVARFLETEEGFLAKDGGILPGRKDERVVGIIKNHNTLYLQQLPRLQQLVWLMPEFYRSSSFRLQYDTGDVLSFYLRIHPPANPETGLLRIEYSPGSDPDEISRWLIAERSVRAHCSRWDRQIYPIQVCEDYLKALLPRSSHLEYRLRSLEVFT
ncbi:MAG: hypothetical protein GXO65_05010 [Euryarchaeota archaeon]|nr:hypothetical protein [Euryarchaeota archaeon]